MSQILDEILEYHKLAVVVAVVAVIVEVVVAVVVVVLYSS